MAGSFCDCDSGGKNTGKPQSGCLPIMRVTTGQFILSAFGSDGTLNKIPAGQDLDAAYLSTKLNEPDARDRWFPVTKYEQVDDVTADPKTEEFPSGKTVIVQEGPTTFKGFIVGKDSIIYPALKSYSCIDSAVFNFDKESNLAYYKADDSGDKFPLRIASDTFWSRKIKSTDETIVKAEVNFQYALFQDDAKIDVLLASDIEADLPNAEGLLDVFGVESTVPATTSTTAQLTLTTSYNTLIGGLQTADFTLLDATTQTPIVLTSATETGVGTGVYDFLFPTNAGIDLEFDVVALGFDGDTLKELVVTTP